MSQETKKRLTDGDAALEGKNMRMPFTLHATIHLTHKHVHQ